MSRKDFYKKKVIDHIKNKNSKIFNVEKFIEKPDLESMTKDQMQQELIKREKLIKGDSHLWGCGIDGWIKYTELYKGNAGRPKKQ